MTKLIASSDNIGLDADDVRANPGALIDIHEDVLRDLMASDAPRQRRAGVSGPASPESGNFHPRRRVCI